MCENENYSIKISNISLSTHLLNVPHQPIQCIYDMLAELHIGTYKEVPEIIVTDLSKFHHNSMLSK